MMNTGKPIERREFGRRKVALEGIIWVPCRGKVPCLVSNISIMGALVELDPRVWLPAKFRLVVGDKIDVDCTLAHRTSLAAGVNFLKPIAEIPVGCR
jgi:hypothetical protein